MGLHDLQTKFGADIKAMAADLSDALPLSKPKQREAFSDEELKKLHSMIKEVKAATDKNQNAAVLQQHAQAALGLLVRPGVAL